MAWLSLIRTSLASDLVLSLFGENGAGQRIIESS